MYKNSSSPFKIVLLLFIATALIVLRIPEKAFNPQLMLEDGTVFFIENYDLGLAALFKSASGYQLLWSRLGAALASLFPISVIPTVYFIFSLISTLIVILYASQSRVGLLSPWLALLIILVPSDPRWIFLSLTLIFWSFSIIQLLVALAKPAESFFAKILDHFLLLVSGLTGPFIIFLFPFLFWRFRAKGQSASSSLLGVAFFCFIVQVYSILTASFSLAQKGSFSFNPDYLEVAGLMFGRWMVPTVLPSPKYFMFVVLILSIFSYLFFLYESIKTRNERSLIFLLSGLLVGLVSLVRCGGDEKFLIGQIDRYNYFVCLTFLLAVTELYRSSDKKQVCALVLLVALGNSVYTFRTAPFEDMNWQENSKCIGGKSSCDVPILGWKIPYVYPPDLARERYLVR